MKTKYQNNSGFTLIETFVAITVLMIAVLGPMSLLSRALVYSTQIKNETIANYLAQEGIEVVINWRDIGNQISINSYCIDSLSVPPLIPKGTNDCQVKLDNHKHYGNSGSINTIFTRVVKIISDDSSGAIKIVATVSWPGKSLDSVSYIYLN